MKTMGLHCMPTLLSGSLDSGFHMFRGLYEPMSAKKLKNATEYATLYPEFKFAFVGDNGQGDVRAGELMKHALGEQVEAVFIHQVQPLHRTPGYAGYQSLQAWQQAGVHFFYTYVGAALQAARLRMIHPNGLRRIIIDAVLYFREIKSTLGLPFHVVDARRMELNRDIEHANEYLTSIGVETCALIPAECLFPVGASVETNWGVGSVERFNAVSGIYEIRLTDWRLTNGFARAYMHGSDIMWHTKGNVGDAVYTRFGTGVLTEIRAQNGVHVIKLTEWGHAASLFPLVPGHSSRMPSSSTLSAAPYAYLQPDDFSVISAAVGDQVQTMFGVGVVVAYRPPCVQQQREAASASAVSQASASHAPTSSSSSDSIARMSHPLAVGSPTVPPKLGLTNVSIYTVKLAWASGGGALAYLNGRSIRKLQEPSSRRCVVQ